MIPSGTYDYSTMIEMREFDTLEGAGIANTVLRYKGSGDGILWTYPIFAVTFMNGSLHDLTLIGNPAAKNCIHVAGINQPTLHDLLIGGCSGEGAVGLLLENIASHDGAGTALGTWMERIRINNVDLGPPALDNQTNLEFRNNSGSSSFDYSDISVTMNVHCGGTGVLIGPNTDLFQVQLNVQGNVNDPCNVPNKTEALAVKGLLRYSRGFIGLEGGNAPNAFHVYKNGVVLFQGSIHGWISGINPAPVVDPGGFYQANPFVDFSYPNGRGTEPYTSFVQRSAKKISSDGTVAIASGQLSGVYDIVWPETQGHSDFHEILVSVSCPIRDHGPCQITTLSNQYQGTGPILSDIRVLAGSSGDQNAPHLVVNVGNRAGGSGPIYASAWGAGEVNLFPADPIGRNVISSEGLTVHSGTGSGLSWQGGATIPSSSNVIRTIDDSSRGTCVPNGYITAQFNGATVRLATCK